MLMMSNAFSSPPARGRSLDFIGASHPRLYLHLRHLCRTSSSARCQIECHKECQVACQNIYQRRYQTECQIKCQIECQNIYIYIWLYLPEGIPDRMSEYMSARMPDTMTENVSDWISVGGDHSKKVICVFELLFIAVVWYVSFWWF